MSLTACLKKAGKALRPEDAQAIRDIYQEIINQGVEGAQAEQQAVTEYLDVLALDERVILDEIKAKGGDMAKATGALSYSKDTREQLIANDISITGIIEGTETIEFPRTGEGGRVLNTDLQRFLAARTRRANRGRPLVAPTARNKAIIVGAIVKEVTEEMGRSGNGADWYSETLNDARSIAALEFPELATNPVASTIFDVLLGVYSHGTDMQTNSELAFKAYAEYRKTGKISLKTKGGPNPAEQIVKLEFINRAIDQWGIEIFAAFMTTPMTVKELRDNFVGPKSKNLGGREHASFEAYGSVILGPKLGMFFQNIHGNSDALTMDRWFTRTMRRLIGVDPVKDSWTIPKNGTEYAYFRELIAMSVERLKALGYDTNTASVQALLWYPEKRMYIKHGGTSARGQATDYKQEFEKILLKRGHSRDSLTSAISVGRSGARSAGTAPIQITDEALANSEGYANPQDRAVDLYRRSGRQPYKGRLRPGSRTVLKIASIFGVKIGNTFQPDGVLLKVYAAVGMAVPEFHELFRSEKAAALFKSSATAAGVKEHDEYYDARLLLTEDGTAGIAIRGDTIISMFQHPLTKGTGLTNSMLALAVELGARRLTVSDTQHPHYAAKQGFEVVARVPGEPDTVFMSYTGDNSAYVPGEGTVVKTVAAATALQDKSVEENHDRINPESRVRYMLPPEIDKDSTYEDNPLVALHKVAVTMEQQSDYNPTMVERLKSQYSEGSDKAKRILLGAIPRRHIQDFMDTVKMPALALYNRVADKMDARGNELVGEGDVLGKKWGKLVKKAKPIARILNDLMHASTLNGVDPSTDYQPLYSNPKPGSPQAEIEAFRRGQHEVLVRYYNGKLNKEAREIFNEVREFYVNQRKLVKSGLDDRIRAQTEEGETRKALLSTIKDALESGYVTGPYFPLMRFGDWWAAAHDAEGNTISFARFETNAERKVWVSNMRQQGFIVKPQSQGHKNTDKEIAEQVSPLFAARITSMAKQVDENLANEIWQVYLRSLPELSMRKQYMNRKGRHGFSGDALRIFSHSVFHGSRQIARLENMGPTLDEEGNRSEGMEGYLEQIRKESAALIGKEDKDATWGIALHQEMQDRHAWAMDPKANPIATWLTSAGFVWYLGFTPAAAFVNLSQTALVAFPVLTAQFGSLGSMKALLGMSKTILSSWGPNKHKFRGSERDAYEAAEKMGTFDKTRGHDLAGLKEHGIDYHGGRRQFVEAASWMFHTAEKFNREITFMAAYKLAAMKKNEDGTNMYTHEQAIIKADDLTKDAHFDYNNLNRPRHVQGNVAKVLFLFRNYSLNMTYRLARDFNDSLRGATPELKKQARIRFGGLLMMTGLLSGATGMPIVWSIQRMLEGLFGDEDDPYDAKESLYAYLAEQYGSKMAMAIMRGPWDAFTGQTLSSRVSLSTLWWREADPGLEGRDLFAHYVGEIAGPIPGVAEDAMMAMSALRKTQDPLRALEYLLPKFAEDVFKTARFMREGVTNFRGDAYLQPGELSNIDLFWQSTGFIPASLTQRYDEIRGIRNTETRILMRKQAILDKAWAAARVRDRHLFETEIRAEIKHFNEINPRTAITGASIRKSLEARRNRSRLAIPGRGLVMRDQDHRWLLEQMRLTGR